MKNLSLILNIVLLLAVAYLFVDKFSSKKPGQNAEAHTTEQAAPLNIVYINIDSLHSKSLAFGEKRASLEERQKALEASLKSKSNAFQKEVMAFQQKVQTGTMTPKQAAEEEQRLARKEQTILAEQESKTKEMLAEMDNFNESFTNEIRGYLDSLKAEMKYDYILTYGLGSPVLVANDSLDITQTVVDLLNKAKK